MNADRHGSEPEDGPVTAPGGRQLGIEPRATVKRADPLPPGYASDAVKLIEMLLARERQAQDKQGERQED